MSEHDDDDGDDEIDANGEWLGGLLFVLGMVVITVALAAIIALAVG